VNHVNLINACWELFIKTIEKIITPTNIKTTKARILRTLSVRKISLLLNDENERKLIWKKKAPFPTGCGKVIFVSKGCIYWRSANFWKFCGFPLKQLGFWRTITVQHCTLLNCVVKYSSVLLSLYFRRYLFFLCVLNPPFFTSISNRLSTIRFMSLNFDLHTILLLWLLTICLPILH